MKLKPVSTLVKVLVIAGLGISATSAQESMAPPAVPVQAVPPAPAGQPAEKFSPEELDQMLAPIALYPDALVSQILMASTYPLEVVEADRWLQKPDNTALTGDQLSDAVQAQSWDPSVKSLAPFPQILRMMDTNLEWTENLGDAFLTDQAAVMDSIQRLRQRAEAAGDLRTTSQEVVSNDDGDVVITPPSPDFVYVPVCDPAVIYGTWPYPDYPPYYFTGFYTGLAVGDFGCGWWGGPIIEPFWGWGHWDWRDHRLDIDRERYAKLNGNRAPFGNGDVWQHDPSHRRDVPYGNPTLRSRFNSGASNTGNIGQSLRGYPTGATQMETPHVSPTFESFGRGSDVRTQFQRGFSSRMSMPSMGQTSMPSGSHSERGH